MPDIRIDTPEKAQAINDWIQANADYDNSDAVKMMHQRILNCPNKTCADAFRKLLKYSETQEVDDADEVLCDSCEDEYYQEESSLNEAWEEYYAHLDDTDGNYKSWLCENCGDPLYDCGCDDDQILCIEEEL